MTHSLPETPSLEQLKKQAKELLAAHKRADPDAAKTLRLLPRLQDVSPTLIAAEKITLGEAQQALALSYGYKNWAVLKRLASHDLVPPTCTNMLHFRDYCWVKENHAPAGRPVGISPMDPKQADGGVFKFIQLAEGERVEQYDDRGRFVKVIYDPADSKPGTRKLRYQDNGRIVGAVCVDEAGVVRTCEVYSYLSEPSEPHPLVKAEIYNADGRLIEIHTPQRVGPNAQDIRVTDVLGKLKAVLHHEELDKGQPVRGWDEWQEFDG